MSFKIAPPQPQQGCSSSREILEASLTVLHQLEVFAADWLRWLFQVSDSNTEAIPKDVSFIC